MDAALMLGNGPSGEEIMKREERKGRNWDGWGCVWRPKGKKKTCCKKKGGYCQPGAGKTIMHYSTGQLEWMDSEKNVTGIEKGYSELLNPRGKGNKAVWMR